MAYTRTCKVCGAKYDYCPTCSGFSALAKWHINFDTDVCHDLFRTLSDYHMGNCKAEDVKAVADMYDVKSFSKFLPKYRLELEEAIKECKKTNSKKRALDDIVDVD